MLDEDKRVISNLKFKFTGNSLDFKIKFKSLKIRIFQNDWNCTACVVLDTKDSYN